MFVNCRNLSRLLLFIAGVLFLLLPPQIAAAQTAGAGDAELCDRAGADPDAGIPACTRLLDHPNIGTNVPAVYNQRGVAKVRKGDLDDAVKDFTSALDRNPNYADAFKNRGIARQMQDAYDAAIADFNRGLAFHFKRQLDRAIADFDVYLRLAPDSPTGYLDRASARMDKGDYKGAVDDYNQAIRLDPNNSGPYTRRGEAWRLQGNLQQSLADHNKAIALNPNDKEAYNNRALTLKDQGKLDEAIADCDEAIMLDPAYDSAYATRGLIRRLKGNLGGSLTDLNKAVTLDPRSPVALTFRGDTLRETGNYDGALADFNKVILMILPDCVAAHTGRGLTYEKIGDLARAKADFEKALSLSADLDAGLARPAQDEARTRLAALAEEAKRANEAAERAAKELDAKEATRTLEKVESAKLVPEDIQQLLQHRGHALLIGVSDYKSGWPQLPNVKNDLHDLTAGLEPYFETVEIVPNPFVAQLRDRMGEFLLGQWNKPDERLFIYYAGHGFTDFNQSSRDNDGYITGSDTPGKAVAKAMSFYEVDSWSRQTRARHVLMVFDACFSGSLFQTMGPPEDPARPDLDGVRRMLGQPMRYYITAGRQNEEVAADSTFATLLLRGLRGGADTYHMGIISADDLGSYLYHEVPKYSPRPQTPQYKSIGNARLSEGQFFFLTEPAAADKSAALARAPTDTTPTGTTPGTLIKSKLK